MEEFRKIKIDLSPLDLATRLESYKRRAADLSSFVKAQKWGIQHIHIDRTNEHRPKVQGTHINDLVLEGLYRRFRFFILNDEPANHYRLLRLLSAASEDELWHRHLRVERKEFFQSGSLEFAFIAARKKYRPDEVIDFWFNAYYFHDQNVERSRLEAFENIVSAEGAKALLWECVWNSVRKIRNLAWLAREATPNNPFVYVPVYSRM